MSTLVWADISLDAIKHNAQCLKSAAPNSKFMAIIKADAYGHGANEVAQALSSTAEMFAVARIDEALLLRKQGITLPITVLNGCISREDFTLCQQHKLLPVIYNLQGLEQALKAQQKTPMQVWLKIDTGMHRLGLSPEQALNIHADITASESLELFGLMSHLSNADDIEHPKNAQQLATFKDIAQQLGINNLSLANSAATLFNEPSHFHWLRPGISLYGIQAASTANKLNDLQAAMTLKSRIIHIQELGKNESIGYSETFTTTKNSRIATIAIGYGDGYPRHAPNGTPVLIHGKQYPLAGRVSMDLITVDISDADSDINIGDEATLWGQGLPIEPLAKACDTIAYELVSKVTSRVKRNYY